MAAIAVSKAESSHSKTHSFSAIPKSADDLSRLDIRDECLTVCAVVFALAAYEHSSEVSREMLEYINGSENVCKILKCI